ncbi:MAG: hypothetical protein GVY07_07315 [Bacteroidetes bacterium]|jgi:hypothetical protein|nr:hypothetical protein [Bacteroidota bacterium]
MKNEKSKRLRRTEQIGFILIMAFIFIFAVIGLFEGMLFTLGFAVLFKVYVFRLYKQEGLEDLFWKNSSKAGFVGIGTIILLIVIEHYEVF